MSLPPDPTLTGAPAVEVLEVVHAGPAGGVRGNFRVEQADSTLSLAGWVLGLDSAVTAVEIVVDGELVGRTTAGADRPDIAAAFPGTAGAGSCGFDISLKPSGEGQSQLAVEAALEDGGRIRLGELRVATR